MEGGCLSLSVPFPKKKSRGIPGDPYKVVFFFNVFGFHNGSFFCIC